MVSNRIRVLVVDDNQRVLEALEDLLTQHNDRIEIVGRAADASTALNVAREKAVDVILMDIRMPGLDGVDATRIMHVEKPDVPVILMSAYEPDERNREGRAAGAAAVVSKSDPRELLDALMAATTNPA